ncbi:MAG TPA: hypothetical protein PKA31_03250 [Candidatus Moranbacteria bacterium]|nr:hypothetical protein [Candidatus Moranbacteria bacterium]
MNKKIASKIVVASILLIALIFGGLYLFKKIKGTSQKYENSQYNFELTMPATWKGFKVEETDTKLSENESIKNLYFKVPVRDDRDDYEGGISYEDGFIIMVTPISAISKCQEPDCFMGGEIGRSDKYYYGYLSGYAAGYFFNDEHRERLKETQGIIDSFKIEKQ